VKRNTNGATVWARKTVESDVFFSKPDKWFKVWFYIISHVNYADCKELKKGENFMTYSEIMLYTKATKDQIDKFMRWAKADDMIATRKTTRGMVITVLNYAKYQTMDNYKSDMESVKETTARRQQDDTIKEEIKKLRIKESIISRFAPPTLEEVKKYCTERNNGVNSDKWHNFYSAKGWMVGKNKMKDWKAAVRTWEEKKEKSYTEKELPKIEEFSEEQRKNNLEALAKIKLNFQKNELN